MKKILFFALSLFVLGSSGPVSGQMVGDNTFLPGQYLEVGIAPNGSLGTTRNAPSGYYSYAPGFTLWDPALGAAATSTAGAGGALAMVYDAGHDGWTVGIPPFFGDYTLPGDPYEGWGIEINGTHSEAQFEYYESSGSVTGFSGGTLTGAPVSYTNSGGHIIAVWHGSAASGQIQITQTTQLDTSASWLVFNVTLVNTGSSSLTNIYYLRACDPDNDSYTGGSPTTDNSIDFQDDYANRVQVTAAGTHYTHQTLSLLTKDCRARCFIEPSWPISSSASLATLYSETSSSYIYSGTDVGDYAMGIVWNIGTIGAGDSTKVFYAYAYDGLYGIDSAIAQPQLVTLGSAHDTTDTVTSCSFSGDTLYATISNADTGNWTGSTWTWSPATSLTATTGTSSAVIMSGITSIRTYTVTGTIAAIYGSCATRTILLTVLPAGPPAPPTVRDTAYCLGTPVDPLTAVGTSLLWYTSATGGTGSTTAPTASTTTAGVTTYWVTQTIAGCVSSRAALHVTITNLPGTITGPSSVCVGSSMTVSDTVTGGYWTSSSVPTASVDSSTGVVSGMSAGPAIISYSVSSGCASVKVITVNPLPYGISGASNVCTGATTSLSDIGGGTWSSSPATTATVGPTTGTVSGISAGPATITYTLPTGCAITKSMTVNPSPLPITGSLSVCLGYTSALTDTTTGGAWSSSNAGIAPVSAIGVVSGVYPGTAVISYTAGGCSAMATVTVFALPSPIAGLPTVCVGFTNALFSSGTGTWTSSDTSKAKVNTSGVVTGVAGGAVTITYTQSTGCYQTFPLTVYPQPGVITGSPDVCIGSSTTLSDTAAGGSWSSTDPGVGSIDPATGILTGLVADTVTVIYTSAFTGCFAPVLVTVNSFPGPITGFPDVCVGSTATLSESGPGTWSTGSSAITIGSLSGVVTGISTSTGVIVTFTSLAGCTTTASISIAALPPHITASSPTLCVGATTHLADSTAGLTWNTTPGGHATVNPSTGLVTGVSIGTQVITYINYATGCYQTFTVTVNSAPGPIISSTGSGICSGAIDSLSDATAGGTWSISSLPAGDAAIGASTGVFTAGASAGTATITYSVGSGCITTFPMTINPAPGAITGTASVCVGSSTSLTAPTCAGCAGGTWTPTTGIYAYASGGTIFGVSTAPTPPTTVIITYTPPSGCPARKIVTVNPLPSSIAGPSPSVVCVASTIPLTDATGGGVWFSTPTTAATISPSGVVTGIGAGVATITYKLAATSCLTTTTVTVNPLPATFTVTGGGAYCAGGTGHNVGLSGSVAGVTYVLELGGVPVAGDTLTGTGSALNFGLQTAGGTYTVVATNSFGCSKIMTGSIPITVNPVPVLSGPTAVCIGSIIVLSPSVSGGTWISGSPVIASVPSLVGSVTGHSLGAAVISYTLPSGCSTDTTITVSSTPGPITGPASVCEFSTVTLTDSVGGGVWSSSLSSVASVGSLSGVVTGNAIGTATISYSLGTGCTVSRLISVTTAPSPITGISAICLGATTTLHDPTSASGGIWTSSGGVSTGAVTVSGGISNCIVTGIAVGVGTVSYSTGGCAATYAVTVNPLPGAILGNPNVCVGSTTTLSDDTASGTWSIVSSTGPLTGAGIGTTSGVFTAGSTPGHATVNYTAIGCSSSIIVNVNPLPSGITGTFVVCQGASVSLSDGVSGGTWSSSNTSVATVGATGTPTTLSGVLAVPTNDSVRTSVITYSLGTGCNTTQTITVNPLPGAISGPTSGCVGRTAAVTDAPSGGTWNSSNASVASIVGGPSAASPATAVITDVSPGVVTINYIINGCASSMFYTVDAVPASITGTTNICVGNAATLSEPAGSSGVWSSSDYAIALITSVTGSSCVVTGISTGTVVITYAVGGAGGCTTPPFVLNVNGLAPITGPGSVCMGQTIALADSVSGGSWGSSDSTKATIDYLGVVTGVASTSASGPVTIVYSLPSGCTATKFVTVNPLPSPIVGASQVCVGQSTHLTDPLSPGGTWTSSSPGIGSIDPVSGVFTGIAGGTTIISYSLGGCPVTRTETVNGLPSISGPPQVCLGGTILLSGSPYGGTWSGSSSIAVVDPSSGAVTGASIGTTNITYSSTGCLSSTPVAVVPPPPAISGNTSVCEGESTVLSDSITGGVWSSDPGSAAIATIDSFSGIVSAGYSYGIVVVTYTAPGGCTVTDTVTVHILPLAIGGATVVCQGVTDTLSEPITGGAWSSSVPSVAPIDSATGIFTAGAPGSSTITYTLPTGCTTSAIVFVNPSPAPVIGYPAICVGLTTNLSDSTTGGAWSSSMMAVGTVDTTGIVTGLTAGTTVISYLVPGTSCPSTMQVSVNPLPLAITGGMNVCQGATTTLGDPVSGGVWASADSATATIDPSTGVVTAVITGASTPTPVTIIYTLGAGCDTTTTIMVNPIPAPISGPNQVCERATITLSDATTGGSWSSSDTLHATVSATGVVTGILHGVATISYTNAGCPVTHVVTINPQPGVITGPVNICVGGAITLFDTIGGGTWMSSATDIATVSAIGVVSGHTSGPATIIYTLPGGCNSQKNVVVYALPTAYSVTGGGNYCAEGSGVHVGLSGSNIGSTYLLYHLSTAVGTFTGTGGPLDFGLLTVVGAYHVVATSTATSCTNNMLGTATVGIIPSVVPAVSISTVSDTVCNGASTTFTAIPVNGGAPPSYEWNIDGVDVAVGSSYTFIPANGDVVKVTMTSTANCALPPTASSMVTMVVEPFGTPEANILADPGDTVCKGSSVTVTAMPLYGGPSPVYAWYRRSFPSNVYLGGGPSYSYVPHNGDSVYVVMQSDYYCRLANADTSYLRINVDSPMVPVVAINANPGTVVGPGTTVTLTATVTGGSPVLTYQWYRNGYPITGATTNTYVTSVFGTPKEDSLECMVVSTGLCPITSYEWVYIKISTEGVAQIGALGSDITVLPNPNKGTFTVRGTLGTTTDEEVDLELTDLLGQVVYRNSVIAKNGKLDEQVSLSNTLANGMYILNLRSGSDTRVFHVVIEQ